MLEVGGVRLDESFLILGDILEGVNGIGTAGRNTRATVDAAFWVDVHLSRSFETGLVLLRVDAVGRADLDAQRVFDA